jgi:carboxyl-terminal processing protease
LKGVESDIPMKDLFTYEEIGERYDNYALPWDQVSTSSFSPLNNLNKANLVSNSAKRLAQNKNYQFF